MTWKARQSVSLSALVAGMVALLVFSAAPGQSDLLSRGGPGLASSLLAQEQGSGDSAKPIPLINIDEEMGGYLKDAQEMIQHQDFPRAIEVLQALLGRVEQCFVPTADPRRYVSLALRVSEVIGSMPPEALKLYRSLYDPQAEQLYQRAVRERDEAGLADVVRRFFHTSYGDDALNLLGTIYFDRGEFSQAARCWQDVYASHSQSDLEPPTLLAKIAVAHRFAGEQRQAEAAMKLLREKHSGAEAVLAGTRQNVAAYAEHMLAGEPPRYAVPPTEVDGWPSMAGRPDSVAVMSSCRPVLSPRWTRPGGKIGENPNVQSVVGSVLNSPAYRRSGQNAPELWQREGQVFVVTRSGNRVQRTPLPAVIHPVAAGNTVIFRDAEGLVAYDLLTGEKLWASFAFPLQRPLASPGRPMVYFNPYGTAISDPGSYTLTVGEGKVFAVGKFLPMNTRYYARFGGRQGNLPADTSVLAAFSLTGEGRLLWRVGEGEGGAEILQSCKFLTAPTYSAGRLYLLAEHLQGFHLLCLSAETGQLVWSALAGQMPVPSPQYPQMYYLQSRGSPPAVADGRVLAVTNGGVLAAFDALSGRALWAYQYPSSLAPVMYQRKAYSPGQINSGYPPNPIVLTKGKAICLPADAEQLLALRVDSGELVWSHSREQQHHLAAVDDSRVLLSGDRLVILDVGNGEELWSSNTVKEVFGRPAVTKDAILASGKGEIVRLSLSDYSVTRPPLVQTDGILGNLVCVGGKLLAANAAGVSAYFAYTDAREELTRRIQAAEPAERGGWLQQRGMNAFNAGKPEEALEDFLQARRSAQQSGDAGLMAKAEQALYRAYVSLGDRSGDPLQRHAQFTRALELAYSDRSRGEMLVRLSKHYEQIGQNEQAAALAQQLTLEYADTDLVDVDIGPRADPFVRDDPDTPRLRGYELGHQRIKQLIAAHGQGCYAAFDAKAKADLDAAAAADDAEACLRVVATYRHSQWAPAALLLAGQSYYRKAGSAEADRRPELLRQADQYLGRIIGEYPDTPLTPSAWLGMTMVRQRRNPKLVRWALRGMEKLDPAAQASFAGASGTVGEILRRYSAYRQPFRPESLEPAGFVTPPLAPVISAGKDWTVILRDTEGRAPRLGESIFLLSGDRLILFDTAAQTQGKAVKWETQLAVDTDRIYKYGFSAWSFSLTAGLSGDQSVIAVVTRGGFAGVSTATGKVLWQYAVDDAIVSQMYAVTMSEEEVVVLNGSGEISVLDKRTGKRLWQHRIGPNQLPWRAPPQVAGGVLLVGHGQTELTATLFDMSTQKALGSVAVGGFGVAQASLTPDGMLLICDGSALKFIEPVAGLDQPVWTAGMGANLRPKVLFATESYVLVAPSSSQGLIQRRSLVEDGRVEQVYQTGLPNGRAALPVAVTVVGDRLYVLAGSTATQSYIAPAVRVLTYTRDPSLQVFDLASGKRLWDPVDLNPGAESYVYAMPPEVGRKYVCALTKVQPFTRPSTLRIIDSATGENAQEPLTIPGVQANQRTPNQLMMLGASPVLTSGRLVLDTPKGVVVYGRKD